MPAKYPEALSLNKVDLIVSLDMGCLRSYLQTRVQCLKTKITKALCLMFKMDQVHTSPYHSQSNGALKDGMLA